MYMKKGWLIKQGTSEKDWKKHWFVLTGNSLRYYKDAKAEETNTLDGRIDLSTCYDIVEVSIGRNYGFRIKVSSTPICIDLLVLDMAMYMSIMLNLLKISLSLSLLGFR